MTFMIRPRKISAFGEAPTTATESGQRKALISGIEEGPALIEGRDRGR